MNEKVCVMNSTLYAHGWKFKNTSTGTCLFGPKHMFCKTKKRRLKSNVVGKFAPDADVRALPSYMSGQFSEWGARKTLKLSKMFHPTHEWIGRAEKMTELAEKGVTTTKLT